MGIDVAFFSSFSPHAGLMAKCPILSACHDAFLYFKATKTVEAFGIGSAAEQWPTEPFFKALFLSASENTYLSLSHSHTFTSLISLPDFPIDPIFAIAVLFLWTFKAIKKTLFSCRFFSK